MYKFQQVGTKHKSYIDRFIKKWSMHNKLSFNKIDDNHIDIYSGDEIIDTFTSNSTYMQFINVNIALGMIESTASEYKVIATNFDFKKVTNAIFSHSDISWVMNFRNSRKICFLYLLNLINDKVIKEKGILKQKGFLTTKEVKSEVSLWEEEAVSSFNNITYVIERLKNEYKI